MVRLLTTPGTRRAGFKNSNSDMYATALVPGFRLDLFSTRLAHGLAEHQVVLLLRAGVHLLVARATVAIVGARNVVRRLVHGGANGGDGALAHEEVRLRNTRYTGTKNAKHPAYNLPE